MLLKSGQFNENFSRILTAIALKNTGKSLTASMHYLCLAQMPCLWSRTSNPSIQCIMKFLYVFYCAELCKPVGLISNLVMEKRAFLTWRHFSAVWNMDSLITHQRVWKRVFLHIVKEILKLILELTTGNSESWKKSRKINTEWQVINV